MEIQCKTRLAVAGGLILAVLINSAFGASVSRERREDPDYSCGPKELVYFSVSGCSKGFIQCKYGNITTKDCPSGKFWNDEKAKCDAKKNVSGCKEADETSRPQIDLTTTTRRAKPAEMNAAGGELVANQDEGNERETEEEASIWSSTRKPDGIFKNRTRRPFCAGRNCQGTKPPFRIGDGIAGNDQAEGHGQEEQGSHESAEEHHRARREVPGEAHLSEDAAGGEPAANQDGANERETQEVASGVIDSSKPKTSPKFNLPKIKLCAGCYDVKRHSRPLVINGDASNDQAESHGQEEQGSHESAEEHHRARREAPGEDAAHGNQAKNAEKAYETEESIISPLPKRTTTKPSGGSSGKPNSSSVRPNSTSNIVPKFMPWIGRVNERAESQGREEQLPDCPEEEEHDAEAHDATGEAHSKPAEMNGDAAPGSEMEEVGLPLKFTQKTSPPFFPTRTSKKPTWPFTRTPKPKPSSTSKKPTLAIGNDQDESQEEQGSNESAEEEHAAAAAAAEVHEATGEAQSETPDQAGS